MGISEMLADMQQHATPLRKAPSRSAATIMHQGMCCWRLMRVDVATRRS